MITADNTQSFVVLRRRHDQPRKAWETTANCTVYTCGSVAEAARQAVANAVANLCWTDERGVEVTADVAIVTTSPSTDFAKLLSNTVRGDLFRHFDDVRLIHGRRGF
jgi:hypothetical protein